MLAFQGLVNNLKCMNQRLYMSAQGDAGQSALLSKHAETQPAGSSATQDDEVIPGCMCHSASLVLEALRANSWQWHPAYDTPRHAVWHLQVIMLDGKDGQFRDAAPGWQPSDPSEQQQAASEAQQQPELPQQQPVEQANQQQAEGQASEQPAQQPEQQQAEQQPAEGQASEQPEQHPEQQQAEQQPAEDQASEQQPEQQAEGQPAETQASEQQPEQQSGGLPAEGQASEQPEQQSTEQAGEQASEGQASEQQEQQPKLAPAMDMLHSLGIRYHEREPGTPASVSE